MGKLALVLALVALVALLDSYNPARSETAGFMRQAWQRVKFHIANLTGLRGPELRRYLMEKVRVAAYRIAPGCAAMYYPESNVLIRRRVDGKSGTPSFKNVPVTVRRVVSS